MMELINQTHETVNTSSDYFSKKINKPVEVKKKISVDLFTIVQNAKVLMKHNEYKLAIHLLREALQKDSKNAMVLKVMAVGLDALARYQEAEKVLEVLCREEIIFSNLVLKAHNYYKMGNDQNALQSYFEALALVTNDEPELFEVHKNIGNIFVRQSDFESAEENYNKAYTKNANSDTLLVNYGTLEVQKGDLDKALLCFRRAVEINPQNDRAWVGLGMVHSQFGDFELAWGNFIKASDINPLNRTALILLAQGSTSFRKSEVVIERLIEFVYNFAEDTEMSILLVKLFIDKGDTPRAYLEFQKAFYFHPENEELKKLWSCFHSRRVAA